MSCLTLTLERGIIEGSLVSGHLHGQELSSEGTYRCWGHQIQWQVPEEAKGAGDWMWGHTCTFPSRRLNCSYRMPHFFFFSGCSDHRGLFWGLPALCLLSVSLLSGRTVLHSDTLFCLSAVSSDWQASALDKTLRMVHSEA